MEARKQAAHQAADWLTKSNAFANSKHITCYLSFKDEFPTQPILEAIWDAKKICYVPMLAPDEQNKELLFGRYDNGDALRPNRYGLLEPAHPSIMIDPHLLDLVITPLIAFDKQGNRLGTGGGFYDTTFSFITPDTDKPIMVGLGYAAQEAPALPADAWDVKLAAVLTEQGYLFGR